ncbi:P-loop containing nucleoside triphosphate hydrolase protein [Hysterangium stoloniferum]|nr:P-loop containing nucleoside triphosphate hydrolase protein [Hysterangium stoloniferum]
MSSTLKPIHYPAARKLESADSTSTVEPQGDTYNEPGFGIKELSLGTSSIIDVVAIHGFDGHREKSWTGDNGKLWLRDFLPQAIPTARILSYGYDAYTESSSSQQTLHGHAQDFLARLSMFREADGTTKRPIIFIAHSLGGIILKSALIQAAAAHKGHLLLHKGIHLSTYGILFLGTPHRGTDIVLKFISLCSRPNNILLKHLTSHSELLQHQNSDFNLITADFQMKFFYENLPTLLPDAISEIIVPKTSAIVPGIVNVESIGMHKAHIGMAKFQSIDDNDFKSISLIVQDMIRKAPSAVQTRWTKFDQQSGETSKRPMYIAKLRPSPRFVGQEKYLMRLQKFFAPQSSHSGWKHFLLYGMGGVGKTQICLKFIEELLTNDYGFFQIFWIDASNAETLVNDFSIIADDPVAKSQGVENSVEAVLGWLALIQKKYLLIFDNADEMDGVVKDYLPHICQVHVLITSRNPTLCNHVTESLHIDPMGRDQAVQLFKYAAKFANEANIAQAELSEKIVTKLGFLPLAVDVAGAAISNRLCTVTDSHALMEIFPTTLSPAVHITISRAVDITISRAVDVTIFRAVDVTVSHAAHGTISRALHISISREPREARKPAVKP